MAGTYTLRGHGGMVADRVRTGGYAAALEATVRPGSVVLDIGTGTGIFALIACRLGARRVYAVESGDAIHLARAVARDNGMAERIHFIQGLSTEIELPERADVVVSDLRGVLPPFLHHLPSIIDARERLMVPGGVLIPRADTVRAAPVEAPEEHRRIVEPWDEHGYGFDMGAARHAVLNTFGKGRFTAADLVAEPRTWAVLDYQTIRDPDVQATLRWTVARPATAHGVAAWFDTDLAEGIAFTTGPGGPETIYGTAFFPWPEPVALAEGDGVTLRLQARLTGADYTWVWETDVDRAGGAPGPRFRQNTLRALPLAPSVLRRRAHDFRPELGELGRVDQAVLGMMDGRTTLEQIAREVHRRFPGRFRRWEDALARVGQLSEAYAEEPGG